MCKSPCNLTLAISIEASGAYTLLLYLSRRAWLPRLARRPVAGATALDIFNAAAGTLSGGWGSLRYI